jgi:hypothetical protein
MTEQPVVLVETDVGWQIGVQTEAARGGFVTVYLPGALNPHPGGVYFVPADRIGSPEVKLVDTLNCMEALRHGSARASERLLSLRLSAFVRE